ncbi:MAG TPA: ABC transporter permease [Gemmatimonadaceae bacterium]
MTARARSFERLYRSALLIFPRAFHERYADEMAEFARHRIDSALARGTFAFAREATHLIADLVSSAPREWIRRARDARAERKRAIAEGTLARNNMDILIQDLRVAARGLLRHRAFTIVAALTLALGIGANTAIFSVVNAVLLRPLGYPNPDRLVVVYGMQGTQGREGVVFPDYLEWRAQNRTFEDIGVFRGQSINFTGGDTPQRLVGSFVSASYMRITGATAGQGRIFTEAETEIATKAPVAVLSYPGWQSRFGGDPSIIGKTLVLNGQAHTVVGITKQGIQAPFGVPDVFLPIPYYPNASGLQRGNRGMLAVGLLKPGVAIETGERDLQALAKQQEDLFPTTNKGFGVELQPLKDQIVGASRAPIYIVFGAALVVLLIACANVANLQLARGAARHRELSVRAALGAGRGRIIQQLLTESTLLSLIGGAAGVGLAVVGTKSLRTALTNVLPVNGTITVDGVALAFATIVSLAAGILFGVAPAWKASRTNVHDMLRSRSAGNGLGHTATRNALVVVQLALSLTLLACAGLLTRSLIELQRVNTGFDNKNLMTMQFRLPPVKYDTPDKIWAMFDRAIAEIRTVPGVQSAALVRAFPLTGNGESYPVIVEGHAPAAPGDVPQLQVNSITPEYFSTMGIPRVSGRDISTSDTKDAMPVIVINEEFAAKTWPHQSPLGKRVQLAGDDHWWTVVGVVGNTKHFQLNEPQLLQGYIPHAQRPQIFTTLAVRGVGDPLPLTNAIRAAIWRVDKDQPVWGVASMEKLLDGAVGSPRLIVRLTAGFAIVALLLGAIGIYGVLSYTMAQRTNEVGIRVALGADSRQVVRLVVVEGMRIVAIAVAIGLGASLAATRLLQSQLFGVGPTDVVTFSIVTALLSIVAILACYIPARRASRVDPMVALRTD